MANIYIRDEVLTELDKECITDKGTLERSDVIQYLIDKERNKKK